MDAQIVITLLTLLVAIILFITEWLRVDIVALLVVLVLLLTGVLSTQEALSGFSSPAVLTIAALFVVGGGVLQTGLADSIGRKILSVSGQNYNRLLVVITITVAVFSGFMSDTGTVAVLLPVVISISNRAKINPSKLLIPLSFGALFGGAMTLIGTPPNIIVSGLLVDAGYEAFRFFDFLPVGFALLVSGLVFMLLIGKKLLPDKPLVHVFQRVETAEELLDLYQLPDSMYRLRVRRQSPLAGETLNTARMRRDFNVTVLKILRLSLDIGKKDRLEILPTPEFEIMAEDIFLVQGDSSDIGHAAATWNLGVQPVIAEDESAIITSEAGVAEILLPPRSSLIGKTLVDASFGSIYHLTVLSIIRPGIKEKMDIKTTKLGFGDTLLVQGAWDKIKALHRRRRDFVVMGQPDEMLQLKARKKAPVALFILAGMILLLVTNVLPVAAVAMLAALLMILTNCLTIDDAYSFVDWKSVVLIAGMLPLSTALIKIGIIDNVADASVNNLGTLGPTVVIIGLYLITSFLTQVLSNTATIVLIAPLALTIAIKMSIQPHAFMITAAIASSMAFASPVASPVNTLVMGTGNYTFKDYLKVGAPLIGIGLIITTLVVPLFWGW